MDVTQLRRALRAIVPLILRRQLSSLRRSNRDKAAAFQFASQLTPDINVDWAVRAFVEQPLIVAPFLAEKHANLVKAIGLMQGLTIKPGQVLSVWHCLGTPTAARGWACGRTIINDVMTTDPGGGLCQLSSLIYHLGLLAGLTVIERHHHSRDIHQTDATRFTALGLDATIVYGFKDLRLRNDGDDDVVLRFDLSLTEMSGSISGPTTREPYLLYINREDLPEARHVAVYYLAKDGEKRLISRDLYSL